MMRNIGRAVLLLGIAALTTWMAVDGTLPTWVRMAGVVPFGAACSELLKLQRRAGVQRERDEREQELAAREQVVELREAQLLPVGDLTGDWPEPLAPREHERRSPVSVVMPWSAQIWAQAVATHEPMWEAAEAGAWAHAPERKAAHAAEPNWYRGESRVGSVGWCVEKLARLASIGYKATLEPEDDEDDEGSEPEGTENEGTDYAPRHSHWTMPTAEFQAGIAEIVNEEKVKESPREVDHRRHEYAAAGVLVATSHLVMGMRGLR